MTVDMSELCGSLPDHETEMATAHGSTTVDAGAGSPAEDRGDSPMLGGGSIGGVNTGPY